MPMGNRLRLRALLLAAPLAIMAPMITIPAAQAAAVPATACHKAATGSWASLCTQRKGARNRLVVAIQIIIDSQEVCSGDLSRITGTFGSGTRKGVRCYQRFFHLPVTGVVNKQTWRHMGYLYYYNKRNGWKYYNSDGMGVVDFRESIKTKAWYYGGPKASSEWVRMNSDPPKVPKSL